MGKGELDELDYSSTESFKVDKRNKKFNEEELFLPINNLIKTLTQIKNYYLDYGLSILSVTRYIIKKLVCTDTLSVVKLLIDIGCIILDQQSITTESCANRIRYMITDNKHDITTEYLKELGKNDPDTVNIKDFAKGRELLEYFQDDMRSMFFEIIKPFLAPSEYSRNDPKDAYVAQILVIRKCLLDNDFLFDLYRNRKMQVRDTTRFHFMNAAGLKNFLTENESDIVIEENNFYGTMCQNEEQMRQYLNAASSMLFEIHTRDIFIETRHSSIKFGTLSRCRPIYISKNDCNQLVQKSKFSNDNSILPESNENHDQGIKYTSNQDMTKDSNNSYSDESKDKVLVTHNGEHNKIGTNRFPKRYWVVISSELKRYLEEALEQAKLIGLLTPTNPKGPHVHWPSGHPLLPYKLRFIEEQTYDNAYIERLHSFLLKKNKRNRNWPDKNIVSPEPLVNAGFSYEGNDDEVVCKSCGFKSNTDNWSDDDDDYAIGIHRQTQDDCSFLGISHSPQSKSIEESNTLSEN